MQLTELLSQNSELVITVVSILGTYFLKKYKDEAVDAKGPQALESEICPWGRGRAGVQQSAAGVLAAGPWG